MKNKILLLLLTAVYITSYSVNASRFKFIFAPSTKEAVAEVQKPVYIDTVNHWCSYSAARLYNEGVFTGIKIGENYYFRPDEQITRGDFLLYIDAILKTPHADTDSMPFADTNSIPLWHRSAVFGMYNAGIINGNDENGRLFFSYDKGITRMEAAIILNNILKVDNSFKETEYSDSYLIPGYATGAVRNVTDYGLMQGYTDNSFRPYVKITRAMLADILCHLKDYKDMEVK